MLPTQRSLLSRSIFKGSQVELCVCLMSNRSLLGSDKREANMSCVSAERDPTFLTGAGAVNQRALCSLPPQSKYLKGIRYFGQASVKLPQPNTVSNEMSKLHNVEYSENTRNISSSLIHIIDVIKA